MSDEHSHGQEVLRGLAKPSRALRQMIPAVYDGFRALHTSVLVDGALDVKTKELIALAISASNQCDGCIASHARGAATAGASKEEVAEALGVVIMMNGGPGTVYAPRAYDAFVEFADKTTG